MESRFRNWCTLYIIQLNFLLVNLAISKEIDSLEAKQAYNACYLTDLAELHKCLLEPPPFPHLERGTVSSRQTGVRNGCNNLRVFRPGHNLRGGEGGRKNLRRRRHNPPALGRRLMAS